MQLGDNLEFAGVALALIGIAITILWPTKKWIGYIALGLGLLTLVYWGYRWFTEKPQETKVTPLVSWFPKTPIKVGEPLTSAQLNASALVGGIPIGEDEAKPVYDPAPGTTFLAAGPQTLRVKFMPQTPNIAEADATVKIEITAPRKPPSPTRNEPPASPAPQPPKDSFADEVTTQINNCKEFLKSSSNRESSDLIIDELKVRRQRILEMPDSPDRNHLREQNDRALKQRETLFSQSELGLWNGGWEKEFWTTHSKLESKIPTRHMVGSVLPMPWAGQPESLEGIQRACEDISKMFAQYKPPKLRSTTP
jgi:hypothetical protein